MIPRRIGGREKFVVAGEGYQVDLVKGLEDLELQPGVVGLEEAPSLGLLDGREVRGEQLHAPYVEPRGVAEPRQLEHVDHRLGVEPVSKGHHAGALQ